MSFKPSRMRALFLGLVLALPLCAVGPPETEVWTRVDTGRFEVIGNLDEEVLVKIAQDLETLRQVMGVVLQPGGSAEPRTTVFMFRNGRSFAFYRDAVIGRRNVRAAGAFIKGDGRNYIAATPGPRERRSSVVYHELVHDFISNYIINAPLWFNEGLAEFFATTEIESGRVRVGLPVRQHHQFLMLHSPMAIESLITVTSDSPEYNENSRHGVFYAQSWALTHYLLLEEGHRTGLQDYLELMGKGIESERAFRMAFDRDFDTVQEDLASYLKRPSFGYFNIPVDLQKATPVVTRVNRDDLLYELGSLLLFSNGENAADAAEHFRGALRLNPKHAGAHSVLGTILYVSGRHREAATHFAAATEALTDDYLPYVLHGEFLLDSVRLRPITFRDEGTILPPRVAEARLLFERSTELNPDDPRGWAGLGSTYLYEDGDLTKGISAMERAFELNSERLDVAFHLVVLHLKNGDREAAKQVIDSRLRPSGDEEKAKLAYRALAAADLARADDLAGKGYLEEALETIRRTIAEIDDPALEAQIQANLAEIEGILELNRLTALYNEAVRAANEIQYERALAVIDAVIRETRDQALLTDAIALKKTIEQFIKARDQSRRSG